MKLFFTYTIILLFFAGCGYRSTTSIKISKYDKIAVPIFKNETSYLNKEYKLTDAVQKTIITRTNLNLVSTKKAELILKGTILEINYPVLVEIGLSEPAISKAFIKIKLELFDNLTKEKLFTDTIEATARFIPLRGERRSYAENSLFAKLSLKILYLLKNFLYNSE